MEFKFGRGYAEVRDKMLRHNSYTMSCFNCEHYYQAMGDSEELCQNPDVLEYDMINTESSVYCLRWAPVKGTKKENAKHGFRNGVRFSGRKKAQVPKARKKNSKRA